MTANSAAHPDARGSAVPCKGLWARAGGCGRWASRQGNVRQTVPIIGGEM